MLSSFSARLASSAALRFSAPPLTRVSHLNALTRTVLTSQSQSRQFLTSARLQIPSKSEGTSTSKKTAKKTTAKKTTTTKAAAKKTPAKKAAKPKAKATPKPKKRVAEKPVKPTFNRSLMTPPKRPMSAYFAFNAERIRNANVKSLSESAAISKASGEAWKTLTEADKQVYAQKSIASREEYLKAYEDWYKALPKGYFMEINRRRVAKGKPRLQKPKTLPKAPTPPWTSFLADFREKNNKTGRVVEYVTEAKTAWAALPESEKEVYQNRYKDQREEHLQQLRLAGVTSAA